MNPRYRAYEARLEPLQSTPQSQRQDSNLRYRAYEARLEPSPVHSAKLFCVKKDRQDTFSVSSAVCSSFYKGFFGSLFYHSVIRTPRDRLTFFGITRHRCIDIPFMYAAMFFIFIVLFIVVLLIIRFLFFTLGMCSLVSFRLLVLHAREMLSFYLWYKILHILHFPQSVSGNVLTSFFIRVFPPCG